MLTVTVPDSDLETSFTVVAEGVEEPVTDRRVDLDVMLPDGVTLPPTFVFRTPVLNSSSSDMGLCYEQRSAICKIECVTEIATAT